MEFVLGIFFKSDICLKETSCFRSAVLVLMMSSWLFDVLALSKAGTGLLVSFLECLECLMLVSLVTAGSHAAKKMETGTQEEQDSEATFSSNGFHEVPFIFWSNNLEHLSSHKAWTLATNLSYSRGIYVCLSPFSMLRSSFQRRSQTFLLPCEVNKFQVPQALVEWTACSSFTWKHQKRPDEFWLCLRHFGNLQALGNTD